jgi:hypothetical protein
MDFQHDVNHLPFDRALLTNGNVFDELRSGSIVRCDPSDAIHVWLYCVSMHRADRVGVNEPFRCGLTA